MQESTLSNATFWDANSAVQEKIADPCMKSKVYVVTSNDKLQSAT